MRKTIRYLTKLLVVAMLLFAVGCSAGNQQNDDTDAENTPPPQVDTREVVISISEPYGMSYQDKNGVETTVGELTLQFTSDITQEEIHSSIAEITRVMALVEEQFGALSAPCGIRICQGDYSPWARDGVLCIGYDNLQTQAFPVALGQLLFGHTVNYGIYYGFGTVLAQELGYPTEELSVTVEQALTLCENSPYHLDMNYACFVPAYADTDTLAKVKTLAIDFYQSLTQVERQELLTQYSGALYRTYLNEYLVAHGKKPYENAELDGISFYPCGSEMRVVWEDPYGVYYVHKDYTVRYYTYDQLKGVGDYLNAGYENFRYLVATYRLQAEEMERIAGYLETEDTEQKVDVLFIRDGTGELEGGATYSFLDNLIRMYSYDPYAHEYIHYLTRDAVLDVWLKELFAGYFTERTGDLRIYWNMEKNRNTFDTADPTQPGGAKRIRFMEAVAVGLGHPFCWEDSADLRYMNDAFVANFDQLRKVKSREGLAAHTSFANYIVDLVGEEQALWAVYYDTPVETFGKSWDQLISDWSEYLVTTYSWMAERINAA